MHGAGGVIGYTFICWYTALVVPWLWLEQSEGDGHASVLFMWFKLA